MASRFFIKTVSPSLQQRGHRTRQVRLCPRLHWGTCAPVKQTVTWQVPKSWHELAVPRNLHVPRFNTRSALSPEAQKSCQQPTTGNESGQGYNTLLSAVLAKSGIKAEPKGQRPRLPASHGTSSSKNKASQLFYDTRPHILFKTRKQLGY